MKLVTLGHATLHRVGSVSRGAWMPSHKEVHEVREVSDEGVQTLRELVITIADEHGELREHLQGMRQGNSWDHGLQQNIIVFNIQGPNVQYSTPYATCFAYPALKIGDRYFKLDEVKMGRGTPVG